MIDDQNNLCNSYVDEYNEKILKNVINISEVTLSTKNEHSQ